MGADLVCDSGRGRTAGELALAQIAGRAGGVSGPYVMSDKILILRHMQLNDEIADLQNRLARIDRPVIPSDLIIKALVNRKENIKIKMYQERSHQTSHLHIDYGRQPHVASYSIEPAERIEGNLDAKYNNEIVQWIVQHKKKLMELWKILQHGDDNVELVLGELQATEL